MTSKKDNDVFLESIISSIKQSISDKNETEKDSDIRRTYIRLTNKNMNEDDITNKIASVVFAEMYYALENKEHELFTQRFLENLESLPETPMLK